MKKENKVKLCTHGMKGFLNGAGPTSSGLVIFFYERWKWNIARFTSLIYLDTRLD